jgi:hypothetical protein
MARQLTQDDDLRGEDDGFLQRLFRELQTSDVIESNSLRLL